MAGRKEVLSKVTVGPIGVVNDLAVSPEAEACNSLKRVTPTQFLHRLLTVATYDGIHAGAGGKPVLGILRDMPAPQEYKGSRRHGADFPADEFDITFPIDRKADQIGIGTAKIDGAARLLSEVHDLQ